MTFTTNGSAVVFDTSGTAVAFTVTPATTGFATSPTVTPGAHASTHGAGGADPITTLGTVTTTLGTVTTLVAGAATVTGNTVVAAGSAAGPSVSFSGDTNTGIYSPGADQVGIATAGTARVIVDSSGNVGIGTTPSTSLHVSSATSFQPQVTIDNTNTDQYAPYLFLRKRPSDNTIETNNFLGSIGFRGLTTAGADAASASIAVQTDGANNATGVPSRMQFGVGNSAGTETERMRIDNAGLITGTGTSLGAWTAYTPTLAGTGWAIGSGTRAGGYAQIGKVVYFYAVITLAADSSFGSGSPTITLPLTGHSTSGNNIVNAQFVDTSLGTNYMAGPVINSTTTVALRTLSTSGAFITTNSTTPFTWATTDTLTVSGVYQLA